MKHILLLSMPFGVLERPALGLSLLKAELEREGISCVVRYPSFQFADLLGAENYKWISSVIPYVAFAGDWCFTEDLYGSRPESDAGYLNEVLKGLWGLTPENVNRVREVRAMVGTFLDHCMASIPWEDCAAIGFTSTFEQNLASLALAKRIKALHPEIPLVFGGANWEGEMGRELHRQFPFVDYVCSGEADVSFPVLAAQLVRGEVKVAELPPGVVYRVGGRTESTGRAAPIRNMDSLPIPDFSDYFHEWSESSASLITAPNVLVETSRGCWWGDKSHCTFCGLNGASLSYRSKSASRALEEMQFLSDHWQTDRIEVVDNILDMGYFTDLLPALAKDGRPWEIFYEVKANLSRAHVAALRDAGVARIQPGIESLSDHVLKLMRKGTCGLRNVQLLKWCREMGVGVDWNILYGFPGETRADYETLLALLPAIEFLDAPVACGPIRMDRFSPYFERPEEFGLVNIRPMPPYKYLYPFPSDSLMRVAYHFDFDYQPGESPMGYADDVIRFVSAWRRKGDCGTLSVESLAGGDLLLRDSRPVTAESEYRLSGLEARAYEYCDQFRSFNGIVKCLREHIAETDLDEGDVRRMLESLTSRKLMLTDGSNWLSLALRIPTVTSSHPSFVLAHT